MLKFQILRNWHLVRMTKSRSLHDGRFRKMIEETDRQKKRLNSSKTSGAVVRWKEI